MKFSDYVLVFLGIFLCFAVVSFANVDITKRVNTQNVEYSSKLTAACYDAAQTMNTDNVEKFGCVWNDEDDLNRTLTVFYNSLVYSFNWDNQGRVDEMALYTPVVCLVDINGYYISHNVVFDTSGMVQIPSDAEKRNGLTTLNTWTKNYGGVLLRYFLNDNVEVYALDGTIYSGNRKDVYQTLTEKLPGSTEVTEMGFLVDDDVFNANKNEIIVREINDQCEYYINRHNVIGDSYENQYTFTMPEIAGEDWARLLKNPTMISFLQGYSSKADNRYLTIYALGGGELVRNYHYFIEGTEYHCIESDPDVTKTANTVTSTYESKGVTKVITTEYVVYTYHGHVLETVYNTQAECAKRGATPHNCVYEWN